MSGLRAQIAAKKKAAEAAKAPPPAITAAAPAAASAGVAAAAPKPAPQPAAPEPGGGLKSDVKKGFLNANSGALYPEGSKEGAPELWRGKAAAPVLEVRSSPQQYEVVGNFAAAGHYVGKEDFEISRSGVTLRVRGRTAEGQGLESLVAGLDESVQLPLDADWEGIAAEFVHPTLRVTVPRLPPEQVPARVLPPELMRKLEGLSIEQAQALLPVTKGRPFHRVLWRASLHTPVASGARPEGGDLRLPPAGADAGGDHAGGAARKAAGAARPRRGRGGEERGGARKDPVVRKVT